MEVEAWQHKHGQKEQLDKRRSSLVALRGELLGLELPLLCFSAGAHQAQTEPIGLPGTLLHGHACMKGGGVWEK